MLRIRKGLIIGFVLVVNIVGCVDDCLDRTRSDLDYCNCYLKRCQPSDYIPGDE